MKNEYVSLIPTRGENGVIQWTMIHQGHIGQGGNYPPIDLQRNEGNYKITFSIVDINKTGVTFDPAVVDTNSNPKAINAIWISEKPNPKKAGAYPSQIANVQLHANRDQLVVTDDNDYAVVFDYQLNFIDSASQPVTSIDPEIRNGGNGFDQWFEMDILLPALAGAALMLAALLLVRRFTTDKG